MDESFFGLPSTPDPRDWGTLLGPLGTLMSACGSLASAEVWDLLPQLLYCTVLNYFVDNYCIHEANEFNKPQAGGQAGLPRPYAGCSSDILVDSVGVCSTTRGHRCWAVCVLYDYAVFVSDGAASSCSCNDALSCVCRCCCKWANKGC